MKVRCNIILSLIIIVGCTMSATDLFSQDVITSTNVFIPEGTQVTVPGSLSNSGFVLNNGAITLTGDWLNTLVYQGQGEVNLSGADQAINNNRQSITKLLIDGGGIKTITGSLNIETVLTFKLGILKISDSDTLRLRRFATVEGASSLSHADGAVIAIGSGYKFFPVGKNGNYHPVELLEVTGINPEVEIEVQENLPVVQSSIPATLIQNIYWTRKTISGTFEGSPVALRYNVRDAIEPDHLIILEGNSFAEDFTARETNLKEFNELDLIESRNSLTGTLLALGELNQDPPRKYYFSTSLSPNAANPDNRTIRIFGDDLTATDFRFQVFNRWGLAVYETSSAKTMAAQGWDGRQNGNILPTGVYPYNLSYVNTSGKAVRQTGFITIIQ